MDKELIKEAEMYLEQFQLHKKIRKDEREKILKLVKQARKTSRPLSWLIAMINKSTLPCERRETKWIK